MPADNDIQPFKRPPLWLYGLTAALILIALIGTILWLGPLPPRTVVMSTGMPGSDYDVYGQRYKAILKRSGIELRLLPSAGAVENLQRLNNPQAHVMVGFTPGGLTNAADSPALETLGMMFYEPFWFFYHGDVPRDLHVGLSGKKISVGPEGGATRVMAYRFLQLNGVDPGVAEFLSLSADEAAAALLRGDIEAMAIVGSWDTPVVRTLLASSTINLVNFPRADAYVALYPYLTKLVVPTGVGNMATNRPATDVNLLAPQAELVVRNDLHPAIQFLLLQAATEIHSDPGIFQKAGEFPAAEQVDLPLSADARQFYKSGASFLQRYLPFWLAVLASRLLVLLIPIMGVAYPLLRIAPALYGWSMRRRIFRLYGELKLIESELETRAGRSTQEMLEQLERLEERANRQRVPLGFAHFLYQLRNHIGLVRARLLEHRRAQA